MAEVKEASQAAFLLLMLVSFVTALYAGRAWFGAFMGAPGSAAARQAKESAALLWLPGLVLALLALGLGAVLTKVLASWWHGALAAAAPPPASTIDVTVAVAVIVAGALAALVLHRRDRLDHARDLAGARLGAAAADWLGAVYVLDLIGGRVIRLAHAIDRVEQAEPATHAGLAIARFARAVGRFDAEGVDRVTAGAAGRVTTLFAGLSQLADRRLWEGAIARLDQGLHATAGGLSRMQTGLLHQYYALAAAGVALLFVYAFIVLRF